MKRNKTGTENGFRVIKDGTIEPARQQVEMRSRMFQFGQMAKRGRMKKRSKKNNPHWRDNANRGQPVLLPAERTVSV